MRLFGVTQRELVGDCIGRLFPDPLSNYTQVPLVLSRISAFVCMQEIIQALDQLYVMATLA
jgi:hypothetical protein